MSSQNPQAALEEPSRPRHRADDQPHHLDDTEHGIPAPVLAAGAPSRKAITVPVVTSLIVGAAFIAVFLAAFHAPTSHRLPLGIAGPDTTAARIELAVNDLDGQAMSFHRYPDAAAARAAIAHDEVPAALVTDAHRHLKLMVAGAQGPSAIGSIQATVAAALGHPIPVSDTVPLTQHDSRGLSIFYSCFGVVLAGYLFAVSSYQLAPRMPLAARITSMAAFSAASGLVVASIACLALGAIPAAFATTAAVTALLAFSLAASAGLIMRTCGPAGIPLASIALLILGNASSGGILPPQYLPAWLTPLAYGMPPGIAVRALRGASYFHSAHLATGYTLLACWTVACLTAQYALDRAARSRTRSKATMPGLAQASA
ncbi:ABC transporter permease [Streptomyces sp. NPDC046759]|uniref:ABC transporter permease n=1 Tax=Streptomyces sp. NPDC046759 TaxID=3155019 RepID=UPI003409C905